MLDLINKIQLDLKKIDVLDDCFINLFHSTDFFLNPLKISKNQRFYDVFGGYRKRWNFDISNWYGYIGRNKPLPIGKNG